MEEFVYEVRVPRDRLGVLIGPKGQEKKALEKQLGVKLSVDSEDGLVTLSGAESLTLYNAREVVRAIGRGFNPDIAQLLMRQDYTLEIISLADLGDAKNQLARIRGRIIGADGKARANLERLTECFISVYGKTIAIIGEHQWAALAKRAVEKLIQGSMHSTVWKFLEKMRRQLKQEEMG